MMCKNLLTSGSLCVMSLGLVLTVSLLWPQTSTRVKLIPQTQSGEVVSAECVCMCERRHMGLKVWCVLLREQGV